MCERCAMCIPLYKGPISRRKPEELSLVSVGEDIFFFTLLVLKNKLTQDRFTEKKH